MRRVYLLLVTLGVAIFLVVSALLARVFSVDGAERGAITELVKAQARGDSQAMLDRIAGCRSSTACRGRVAANIATLRQSGRVAIVQLTQSASFSLTGSTGTARVVWTVGASRPIVQCVRVRRAGDVLQGLRVELLALSERIKTDADCPARF